MKTGIGSKWVTASMALGLMVSTMAGSVAMAGDGSGTGVGSGGSGGYAEYVARLRQEMGMTNCGGNCGMPDFNAWCARVSRILVREVQRATLQIQFNRLDYARQILVNALMVASQSLEQDPLGGGPLTKRLVDRGLILNNALDQGLLSNRLSELTKTNFLLEYVKEVINTESTLDRPFFIPYVYQYGRCTVEGCPSTFSFPAFEAQFMAYAKRQIDFISDSFTQVVTGADGFVDVRPVGDPRAFLILSELVTSFVADDLSGTLAAYSNACVIMDLQNLSETLRQYTWMGDRTVYPNDRWAINMVHGELDRLGAGLVVGGLNGCPMSQHPHHSPRQ